ncbi:MAG TPA: hypothetical protein VHY34_08055 [Caulobacteraceae bacterium]|nr:hypothetical protein [Caulobacteraceae bacterium]
MALLDRLASEKLDAIAQGVRVEEGWKWAQARLDFPHAEGLARVYPHPVERSEAEVDQITALCDEYDALVSTWDAVEELPPEIEARFAEIDAAMHAYGDGAAFDADEIARGGVFVVLGHDGLARIERGFIRPEDMPVVEEDPEPEAPGLNAAGEDGGGEDGGEEVEEEDTGAPLCERLVLDLTAQRTMALRDALGANPDVALTAVVHALALAAFTPAYERASCLEIGTTSTSLETHAPGIAETRAARSVAERHERWATQLPRDSDDLWGFVQALSGGELLELLAHCASLTVNALRMSWDRRPGAMVQADRLAQAVNLDMNDYWSPTADSYLGRVTKARIAEAVSEGVSPEAAARIEGLKKPEMATTAEALLAGTRWLPALLRTPGLAREPEADVTPVSQQAA